MERVRKPLLGSDTALWADTLQSAPPELRGGKAAVGSCADDASAALGANHADRNTFQNADALASHVEATFDDLSNGGGSLRSSVDEAALRPPLAVFCNPLWGTN